MILLLQLFMILFLISVCRPLAMSVLHISGILYRISLHPPVQKNLSCIQLQKYSYQDNFFLTKVLKSLTYSTDSRCQEMCLSANLPAITFLTWVGISLTLSGLFSYVFPPSICIQSRSLMSFTEIFFIFILQAEKIFMSFCLKFTPPK